MVKKNSSSSVAPKQKSGTPKITFKKINSRSKNSKKKQLTPFNKLILKKINESKKKGWSSQGNIVEDENPKEDSKENKKRNPSKVTKEQKTEVTGQGKNKIKPLMKLNSFDEETKIRNIKNGVEEFVIDEPPKKTKPVKTKEVPKDVTKKKEEGKIKAVSKKQSSKVKELRPKLKPGKNKIKLLMKCSSFDEETTKTGNGNEELVSDEPPKKAKPDKLVKKTTVKSSSVGKSAKKITKKPENMIPQKNTKGRRKETGGPEVSVEKCRMLSSDQESQPTNGIIDESYSESCSQESKGGRKTRKTSVDSKVPSVKSANLDGDSTEPGPLDKACLEKDQESQPINGSIIDESYSESCSQESKVSGNYPASDSLVMSNPPEELSEPIVYGQGGGDERSLGTNSEAGKPNPDGAEDSSPPLSPTSCSSIYSSLLNVWDQFEQEFDPDEFDNTSEGSNEVNFKTESNKRESEDHEFEDTREDTNEVNFKTESNKREKDHEDDDTIEDTNEVDFKTISNKRENEDQIFLHIEDGHIHEGEGEDIILTERVDQEVAELEESESQGNEAASNSVTEDIAELSTSEIRGKDIILTERVGQDVEGLEESESQGNEAASNNVTEDTEHNTSEIQGEDCVIKRDLEEEKEDQDLGETESLESQDSVMNKSVEKEDKDVELDSQGGQDGAMNKSVEQEDKDVELDSQRGQDSVMNKSVEQEDKDVELDSHGDDVLPRRGSFGLFLTPEKESSSPKRSTVEDDLCLSTSVSPCSSRSCVSLGSVNGLYELSKIKKSKKYLGGPLSSKLPLKRKKDGASIDEIKHKRKCLDHKDSHSSPSFSEPADHSRRYGGGSSQVSPQYHRGLEESPKSESSSGLSPSKIVKIIVKRIDEKEIKKDQKSSSSMIEQSCVPRIPIKDCSVSLTKIDCKLSDIENVSPTSSLKSWTIKNISCQKGSSKNSEINLQGEKPRTSEERIQHRILSNKHITSFSQNINNSSSKDRPRAVISVNSTESSLQGAGRTYSRIVNKQNPSAKDCRKAVNLLDNSLQKEENKFSPGINDLSLINYSRASNFSGFSHQIRTPVSNIGDKLNSEAPAKKPKLCKTDLIQRRKQFKSKHTFKYASVKTKEYASSSVDSPDRSPNRTNQQMGTFQIPVRRVINTNIAKSESSAEPSFKQPQVNSMSKICKTTTSENIESSLNKPNFKKVNFNVNAIPDVSPRYSVNSKDIFHVTQKMILPQFNEYSKQEIEDDNESVLSVAVHPDLLSYVNAITDEPSESTTTGKFLNRNPAIKRFAYSENVLAKPCKSTKETSYEKRDKGWSLKSSQYQFVIEKSNNREKISSFYDDKNEEEEEFINQKEPINKNNEVEYRKYINDFRYGNSLKPNFTEGQTESGFPSCRSRSNSSLSSSNIFYSSDNSPYENPLHGTPFDGYCLFYLRNSVAKNQDHHCDLRHEVPGLLFHSLNQIENDVLKKSTSKGISHICKENCNNPPLRFLDGITMFCIKNKQKQQLTNVIYFLKNSISIDKVGLERYKEIWTHFTKTLVKTIVQWNPNPTTDINTFLQTIVYENGQIGEASRSILYDVLGDLAKMANTPSLKLMHCIKFLKDMRFPVNVDSCPISFIEAVLRQVIEQVKLLNDQSNVPQSVRNFVYLVYRTFFYDKKDCSFMYKESRSLTEEFLSFAINILHNEGEVKAKLNQLQMENGSVREPIKPGGGNIWQMNTEQMSRRYNNTAVPQQQRSNFVVANNFLDIPTSQAILLKEMTSKEVFDFFKTKGALKYLEILQDCEESVKKKHNNVTMSFILLESEKESSWNHCYSLFQEIIDFDPQTVKDFLNVNITPARRLLVTINCCLKSHHIQDAVNLFLRFGLFEADHSKWLVEKSPGDIDLLEKVCEDLKTAFCNLSQFTETEANLFTSIIRHQKSLRAPVYLQTALNNFFWKAANLRAEGGWNAMAAIVSTIVEENLLKQLNLDEVELYRILIRAVCAAENMSDSDAPAFCARLMKKSNKVCDIYPTSWVRDCHELTIKTCLTVEELYAFFIFKIRAFKKLLELKSLHIQFEEYNINPKIWKQPYFRDVDSSIKGAIDRFKIACRRIGLEPTSLIIHKNKITVDKVILQGTL